MATVGVKGLINVILESIVRLVQNTQPSQPITCLILTKLNRTTSKRNANDTSKSIKKL